VRATALALAAFALTACAGVPHHAYGPAPGSYFVISVRAGDTLSEIAQRYRVDEDDLAAMNRLHDHDTLFAGQAIRVPAYGRVAHGARPTHAAPHSQPSTHHTTQVAHATPPKPVRRPRPGITHVSLPPTEPVRPNASAQFVWPLDGVVVSAFGARNNGERNDGINIACTGGEEIRAADSGTVTYVGNELKGYGNLILIKHDNGFTTAYAHADQITVTKGDHVARGQVIAFAGATGDVSEPQLHFELRRGVTPIDPRPYLRTYGS
jgi:murein DD-endopeptidase MepM/ murein hydrolase activator NlpD